MKIDITQSEINLIRRLMEDVVDKYQPETAIANSILGKREPPTWRDTMEPKKNFVSRHEFSEQTRELGYKFYLWDDRIYESSSGDDTGFTIQDLE